MAGKIDWYNNATQVSNSGTHVASNLTMEISFNFWTSEAISLVYSFNWKF